MANLTGQQICTTYGKLLQIDGGQLQDGFGNPVSSLGNFSASYSTSASYSLFSDTASYIDVTGSGVLVNWFGSQLQLTASSGGAGVVVDSVPPAGANQGDLWWDTDDANMYMYYEYVSSSVSQSAWVPASSLAVQALSADSAITASYARTASYVNITGSGVLVNYFGSQIQLTASAAPAVTASYAITSSNAITASYFLTSSVTSASLAGTSSYLVMASYLTNDYVDDVAAAAAGVPLGGVYRSGNMVVVRIS